MTKLTDLKGIGPKKEAALLSAGITSLVDLVQYLPRKYQDRTQFKKIKEIRADEEVHTVAKVMEINLSGRKWNQKLNIVVEDSTGSLQLVYFNGAFFWKNKYIIGQTIQIWGTAKYYGVLQIAHPDIVVLKSNEKPKGSILPLYPLTESMTSSLVNHSLIQKLIAQALTKIKIEDPCESVIQSQIKLPSLHDSYEALHFPSSFSEIDHHYENLKTRELWPLCKNLEKSRLLRVANGVSHIGKGNLKNKILKNIPFGLTDGQLQAVGEIEESLASKDQLNGMLQGDVGSGKTVVSVIAAAQVLGDGVQIAVLLPTEILAQQQFEVFLKFFKGLKIKSISIQISLLLGSTSKEERNRIKNDLESGSLNILIGTHVLFSPDIQYKNLGFIIIDEQHRFGVDQRDKMLKKGEFPDLLYMTATPIPRTLTQSLYGDFTHFVLKR